MTENGEPVADKPSWRFPREFWLANLMELCERAAYYGFFIVLTLYLTDIVGFTDKETGVVAGVFFAMLYFLPPFAGAVSDRIGFKNGLILAFGLLTVGYFFLGVFHSKILVILFLSVVLVGGSFIKPLITGTVAKTSSAVNKARAFSLFYWVVNIGAFGGKTVVPSIRQGIGVEYVNFFSAGMSFVGLILAMVLFKPLRRPGEGKTVRQVYDSLVGILTTPRLISLTLIVAGFWIIQHQLYATMPKYVIRLLGESARPEWLANVNPAVVVICVVGVTQLFRRVKAVTSMFVGMVIMPVSGLAMAFSQSLEAITGPEVSLWLVVLHPITLMMVIGIAIQGLAECFISPRFLEYFALQAPKGEEGTYMGFSHLHSFISALVGFIMSGFLLDYYCPDPKTLPAGLSAAEKAARYADAHLIWYYFAVIAALAAVALLVFGMVTKRLDRARGASGSAPDDR